MEARICCEKGCDKEVYGTYAYESRFGEHITRDLCEEHLKEEEDIQGSTLADIMRLLRSVEAEVEEIRSFLNI